MENTSKYFSRSDSLTLTRKRNYLLLKSTAQLHQMAVNDVGEMFTLSELHNALKEKRFFQYNFSDVMEWGVVPSSADPAI
jgi:hypothetical protein